ncbi:pyridoxal 5'-phosphate synthase glutaminase subunit PdxT [Actinomadura rupiterrae]|uniref:pyridoxal 5'-phosphate synthase glutaminase subunit PdxT n=1 Tax=Actinomadura rupiterrae TaxID=559627 RepID=UPI0027E256CF|nr:pyridoxal 5'-phosphate synthase glutaminase subunit PdxT [Actinomadura rupiterrae]MCP2340867.1 5'-phosphate synthase pdxT subunit [Actinomadura rupiterrae]
MTSVPTIGVLALQGDVREHARALEEAGARTLPVRRPEELESVDGLVIPGGESTTMWRLARSFELLEPLRKRIEAGMPAYGSCAGMIMLADRIEGGAAGQETAGGIDMTVRRNAFGRQVDSFEAPVQLTGMGDTPYHAVFIRAPWVERVGEAVEVLGRAESGPNVGRIVAVRQGRLMATSFHPELTGDHRVHHYFAELVRRATEED